MVDDFALVRSAIRDAARAAWTDLRNEHPSYAFYYFGLWTTPLAHRPAPTACSTEGLERAVAASRAAGIDADADSLRWSVNDSPYDLAGDEHFARLDAVFETFGDTYDRPRAVNEQLLRAMIDALAELDTEGFFGTGDARDAVVVNVTLPGRDEPADALESARSLNPPSALTRYEADNASSGS